MLIENTNYILKKYIFIEINITLKQNIFNDIDVNGGTQQI